MELDFGHMELVPFLRPCPYKMQIFLKRKRFALHMGSSSKSKWNSLKQRFPNCRFSKTAFLIIRVYMLNKVMMSPFTLHMPAVCVVSMRQKQQQWWIHTGWHKNIRSLRILTMFFSVIWSIVYVDFIPTHWTCLLLVWVLVVILRIFYIFDLKTGENSC